LPSLQSLELPELQIQRSALERDAQPGVEVARMLAYSDLEECIRSCTRLTRLGIRTTAVRGAQSWSGRDLSTMLASLTVLKRLDVASAEPHAPELGAALAALPNLEYLDVSAPPLPASDAQQLGKSIATLTQLSILRMAALLHQQDHDGDMAAVLRGMRGAPAALRQLDIGGLCASSDAAMRVLSASLAAFTQVEALDMSGFSLSATCAKVLTQALARMPQLRALHLRSWLGAPGVPEDVMRC
jgi:hypothetical protein